MHRSRTFKETHLATPFPFKVNLVSKEQDGWDAGYRMEHKKENWGGLIAPIKSMPPFPIISHFRFLHLVSEQMINGLISNNFTFYGTLLGVCIWWAGLFKAVLILLIALRLFGLLAPAGSRIIFGVYHFPASYGVKWREPFSSARTDNLGRKSWLKCLCSTLPLPPQLKAMICCSKHWVLAWLE